MTKARDLANLGSVAAYNQTFRNRIINGAMAVDQRLAGASASSGLNVITYGVDRWSVAAGGAAVTMQRLGSVGANYLSVSGAASNTIVNIRQRIESQNIADLAGQLVTVSFVCSSTLVTSVNVTLGCASVQDNFTTVTTIATVIKTINSTGNQYSCQFTLPAGAANGVELIIGVGNLTSGSFSLTNVQLERGAVATPFEMRPIGTELSLCQRYYLSGYKIFCHQGTSGYSQPLPLTMRAAPTATRTGICQTGSESVPATSTDTNYMYIYNASLPTGGAFTLSAEL
jgi:hypothetical protein